MSHPTGPPGPPPGGPGGPYPPAAALPGCARHPDRPTGLSCTRCGRPACPDCLREASVGHQCVDCVAQAARTTQRPRTAVGAVRPNRPVIVPVLIAANVVIYVLTAVQARSALDNYDSSLFLAWALVPGAVEGQWWRVLTSGFLHFGPIHLLLNMYALWALGRDVELVLGRARFLGLYAVSLLGGAAAVVLFSATGSVVAGASGAVFGLMGGLVVLVRKLRAPATQLYVLIGINLVISFTLPGISLEGHLGGLVIGAVATAALVYAPARSRTAVGVGTLVGLAVILLVAIMVRASAIGVLYT